MTELDQLKNAYSKRFKQLNKRILSANNCGLIIFVEHLRYLRDTYIVTQKSADSVATLNAAIEEFEAYIESKNEFHWNNFCEFIKLNMEEWLSTNDSI